MVRRTNAACGGRESVSAMKGEVVSSILTGSTSKSTLFFRSRCGVVTLDHLVSHANPEHGGPKRTKTDDTDSGAIDPERQM